LQFKLQTPGTAEFIYDNDAMNSTEIANEVRDAKKMVCMTTSTFPRWPNDNVPRFVLDFAIDMVNAGWTVEVLAPHYPGAASREEIAGVSVTRFRYLWPESLETLTNEQGGAIHALRAKPWNVWKLPFYLCAQLFALSRLISSKKIDLIHSHWLIPQGLTASIVSRFTKKWHIATAHGGDVLGLQSTLLRALKKIALRRCDAATANSSFTEAALTAISPLGLRVERIPFGATLPSPSSITDVESIRGQYAEKGGPLLLFVGRLIKQKGCHVLLDAMSIMRKTEDSIHLLIVGDGPEKNELEKQAQALDVEDCVSFPGWIDKSELPAYYQAATLFVSMPTVGPGREVEAFGLVYVEAALAQLPTVAVRSGGIEDVVVDQETGILLDDDNIEVFAKATTDLLRDLPRLDAMGVAARVRAEMMFSRKTTSERFSSLYEDVINR